MMTRSTVTLEHPNRVLGLLAAVVVGWALLVPSPFLAEMIEYVWRPAWNQGAPFPMPTFSWIAFWTVMAAMVGLPLSLFFCFGLGYPAWLIASWLGLKQRRDAMIVGIVLGLMLGLVLALLKYKGAPIASQEPLSKLVLFYPSIALYVAVVGAVAGLAAWRAAGRKSVEGDTAVTQVFV